MIAIASDLGVNDTKTDIFPAQDEVDLTPDNWDEKRKGNFVNLPYQKAHMTTRVAMDDECNSIKLEDLYKFVSKYPKDLTTGNLYVASLEQKKWIPVDYDQHKILQENFESQLEVLTYLREASKLIGGTELDRPEDIDIDPLEQGVYIALTNNYLKNNFHGSILKIVENGNKHDSEILNSNI